MANRILIYGGFLSDTLYEAPYLKGEELSLGGPSLEGLPGAHWEHVEPMRLIGIQLGGLSRDFLRFLGRRLIS